MIREIRFRAWDDYHKKMLVVHNLYQHMDADGFTEFECTPKGWSKDGKDYILVSTTAHDNVNIMQYTGLKDKNGKEIYESDIVQYNTGEIWFVKWDAKQAGFIYRNRQILDEAGRKKPSGIGYGQLPGSHEVEIIGNIYENPELLK